jgi:hypothetical protein
VLVAEVDLNLIRQVRDMWLFQQTARFELYCAPSSTPPLIPLFYDIIF